MTSERCPECGTARAADGGPGCGCHAAVHGAEEFDRLGIRPYVTLREPPDATGYGTGHDARRDAEYRTPDHGHQAAEYGTRHPGRQAAWDPASGSAPLGASSPATGVTHGSSDPDAPSDDAFAPDAWDEPLVWAADPVAPDAGRSDGPRAERRRRRGPALAAGAAVTVLALGSALVASGLLDRHSKDQALPDVRVTSLPTEAVPTGRPSDTPSASRSASPSASPSTSRPTPSRTARPTPSRTQVSGTVSATPSAPTPPPGPAVLQQGDSGPEVTELQQRLNQIMDPDLTPTGSYDDQVRTYVAYFQDYFTIQGDPDGVYGANTRTSLESRTAEP